MKEIRNAQELKQAVNFCFFEGSDKPRRKAQIEITVLHERTGVEGSVPALTAKERHDFPNFIKIHDLEPIGGALAGLVREKVMIMVVFPIDDRWWFCVEVDELPKGVTLYDLYMAKLKEFERKKPVGSVEYRKHTYTIKAPIGEAMTEGMDESAYEVINAKTDTILSDSPNRTAIIRKFKEQLKQKV